ncbi:MAG: Flp pilus assembly complex ATPase component TadA [Campylobacteraceae bacterium]|jgi:type IV secretion system protein VirB11|nr:Flp pilus assembly complex ATPase component TadA [Campylobacteraceae bacterium]
MITKVLQHKLDMLDKYLKSGANEIVINKPQEIFLDRLGMWERLEDSDISLSFLKDFCTELASARELMFNADNPILSCSIPTTTYRVQAIHQVMLRDSSISVTIRIPSTHKFKIEDFKLECKHNYNDFKQMVRDKKNVLVSGGTGTGKTSFLNTLMDEIDPNDRIVTIEDSPELIISNINKSQILVPKIETKKMSYENALNSTMRMRPDRILLGEIDTRNTMSFLRLSNTGHSGMLSTLHANSAEDAIKAIITNAMFGSQQVVENVLISYIKTAIDYIIQIQRKGKERVISEVLNIKAAL